MVEFHDLHPLYSSVRNGAFNISHYEAWKAGYTGFPMVDACMRSLIACGWLNFRMRAMIMSFSSYHLWLDWKRPALHLARLFTDYEPGIHYNQVQMQSGTTGINSLRIYNPIKQSIDHDPSGHFIRKWVPELAHLDNQSIHVPWSSNTATPGYPTPIVDEAVARKHAADKLYALRKCSGHRKHSKKIVKKHASRHRRRTANVKKNRNKNSRQGELPL